MPTLRNVYVYIYTREDPSMSMLGAWTNRARRSQRVATRAKRFRIAFSSGPVRPSGLERLRRTQVFSVFSSFLGFLKPSGCGGLEFSRVFSSFSSFLGFLEFSRFSQVFSVFSVFPSFLGFLSKVRNLKLSGSTPADSSGEPNI